ncbi:MAG: hypothetical protein M3011_13015 [Actinomycetota bacterium]|nr:hypothetical protein [Actinomycetota bacterium]
MDDERTDQDDQAPDDKATDDGGPPDNDDDGERLDALGDRIQSVRAEAEEAVEGVADTEGDKYAESGDGESADQDDQTIAPG